MNQFDYDAELRRYTPVFQTAMGIGPGDRVLDVGCGSGQTTRDAAREAVGGSALGVDISAERLADARRLAAEQGIGNATFELADAQRHPFPSNHFDVVISRFGTMFFADPVAAFANLARASKPGAWLVMLVWQAAESQEWAKAIDGALGPYRPGPTGNPFSLADPSTVERTLAAAGFASVDLTDVQEPITYGPDVDTALAAVWSMRLARESFAALNPDEQARARGRLRDVLAAHDTGEGVWFDGRVWLVTARRG